MKRLALLIVLALLSTTNTHSWSLFGPDNYEDCVSRAMKKEKIPKRWDEKSLTELKATLNIERTCRAKFEPSREPREFSVWEIIWAGLDGEVSLFTWTGSETATGIEWFNNSDNRVVTKVQMEIVYETGSRRYSGNTTSSLGTFSRDIPCEPHDNCYVAFIGNSNSSGLGKIKSWKAEKVWGYTY